MFRPVLVLLLLFFAFGALRAQSNQTFSTKNKKAIQLFQSSEDFIIRRQYGKAIEILQQALQKDREFAEAHLRIGSSYLATNNAEKALYHYEEAVKLKPDDKAFVGGYFALADLYFQRGEYSKAGDLANKVSTYKPLPKHIASELDGLLANVAFASEKIKEPLPFKPTPLPGNVNKFGLQYFPVLSADQQQLIFTRRIGAAEGYDEDIVISTRDEKGNWKDPVSISPKINTKNNEGTCTISADGRILIFTSCMGRKGYGSCDLFISRKTGDAWSEPENMGSAINSSEWESQPSLSADGRTLYFVSTRAGGVGKRDIWVSKLGDDNSWSEPENLGPGVNTPDEEVSPFIHANGQTLYFASKGYPGFGGYDIYTTSITNDKWSVPENLGYPLNNADDQVSLFITADGTQGYYSYEKRNQKAYISVIYSFQVPEAIQVAQKTSFVKGKIFDRETKQPLKAPVELYNLATEEMVLKVSSDSITGEYLMILTEGAEYALYVNQKQYLFESKNFDFTNQHTTEPVIIDFPLRKIKGGASTVLNNIFFDTDKYELKDKSKTELNKLIVFLKSNPDVKIQITGYTDDVGAKAYNDALSLNRAKEVFDFLKQHDIPTQRMVYKGLGQANPIVSNDSEKNRQMNRRIEFSIL